MYIVSATAASVSTTTSKSVRFDKKTRHCLFIALPNIRRFVQTALTAGLSQKRATKSNFPLHFKRNCYTTVLSLSKNKT